MTPAQGGASTAVWRVDHQGHRYALRLLPEGTAPSLTQELAAMNAARPVLPMPDLVDSCTWNGRPVMLLDWCPGQLLISHLMRLDPGSPVFRTLARSVGTLLSGLHALPVPPEFQDDGRWIEHAGPDEAALKDQLRERSRLPSSLLHLDYQPFNILAYDTRVTGVIDWSKACAGDPGADLAYTLTLGQLSPVGPAPGPRVRSPEQILVRHRFAQELQGGYFAGKPRYTDMPLYLAWAGAAILRTAQHKIGQPGQGIQPEHLEPVRRWRDTWKRRAGLPA